MGRWLSRDLIDEFGGINLYEFVRNSSFLMIDMLGNGLLDWFQCWLAGGRYQNSNCCCGGFSLNFVTHCCVDGNQYEKDGEVVAIEYKVKNGDSLQGGMNLLPMHYWLEWGINERVDANITNIGRGEVVYSIVPHTELGYNPILPYQKYLPEKNREIKASRCRGENPDVFRACLTRRAKADNGTASRMLCHEYDERLIDYCRKESKK